MRGGSLPPRNSLSRIFLCAGSNVLGSVTSITVPLATSTRSFTFRRNFMVLSKPFSMIRYSTASMYRTR